MKGNLQYKGNVIIQTFRNIKFPPIEILKLEHQTIINSLIKDDENRP